MVLAFGGEESPQESGAGVRSQWERGFVGVRGHWLFQPTELSCQRPRDFFDTQEDSPRSHGATEGKDTEVDNRRHAIVQHARHPTKLPFHDGPPTVLSCFAWRESGRRCTALHAASAPISAKKPPCVGAGAHEVLDSTRARTIGCLSIRIHIIGSRGQWDGSN